MKAPAYLTNAQLVRRCNLYEISGFPLPIDVQGEMIRRGYKLSKRSN